MSNETSEGKVHATGREALIDRYRGCLVGGAVGDALGYAIEFHSEREIFSQYGECGITSCELDPATGKALISDDTQMTLFTATGILFGQTRGAMRGIATVPRAYVAHAYQDWLLTQEKTFERAQADSAGANLGGVSWLLDVPELFHRRAPGNTCLSALRHHRRSGAGSGDYVADAPQLNDSKGCGGVMRVAPAGLAWVGGGQSQDAIDMEAAQIAAITHGHSLGYMPAAVLAHIVGRVVTGEVPLDDAVREARDAAQRLFAGDVYLRELVGLTDLAVDLSKNDDADLDNIHRLGEGWVGEEALAIAIYCALRHQTDFSAGIIAAVNHAGDSDSTGAVCGNILGALLGYAAIDERWTCDLELHDVIVELADDLCQGCQISEYSQHRDPAWECKYIECRRYERQPNGGRDA